MQVMVFPLSVSIGLPSCLPRPPLSPLRYGCNDFQSFKYMLFHFSYALITDIDNLKLKVFPFSNSRGSIICYNN